MSGGSGGQRRVCSVCCAAVGQYTCPRCHTAYCSAGCYKQHSGGCTEAFFREQATSQLKATRAEPEQTQQMLAILTRLHEQQQLEQEHGGGSGSDAGGSSDDLSDSDEDDGDGQEQHLPPAIKQLLRRAEAQGADFDVTQEDLTPEVLAALEGLALRGQLSHLVAPWQPWWEGDAAARVRLTAGGQMAVQELHHHQQQQQQQQHVRLCLSSGVPAGPAEPLPRLAQLAGATHTPSPLLPWQLLQLLVAYCGVLRRFNGEPDTDGGWEATQQLVALAPPLARALQQQQQQQQPAVPPPDSARAAVVQLVEAATAAAGGGSGSGQDAAAALPPDEARALLQVALQDTAALLQLGRPGVLLALSDVHALLLQARAHAKAAAAGEKQLLSGLRLSAQKAWYFLVWANEQGQQQQQHQEEQGGDLLFGVLAADLATVLAEREAVAVGASAGGVGGVLLPGQQQHQGASAVQRAQQQQRDGPLIVELGPAGDSPSGQQPGGEGVPAPQHLQQQQASGKVVIESLFGLE